MGSLLATMNLRLFLKKEHSGEKNCTSEQTTYKEYDMNIVILTDRRFNVYVLCPMRRNAKYLLSECEDCDYHKGVERDTNPMSGKYGDVDCRGPRNT